MKESDKRIKTVSRNTENRSKYPSRNFNRGQTISSYQQQNSERSKTRELIVRRRKMSGVLVSLFVIACLILLFLFQFIAKINVVNNGRDFQDATRYAGAITKYLDSKPLERFISNLDKVELLNSIQKDFPEVKSILDFKMIGLTNYVVSLEMRKPLALWEVEGNRSYVDGDGILFTNNFFDSPALSVSDESGISVKEGKTIASTSFLSFVGKVVSEFQSKGYKVQKITIPPSSLRQVNIYLDNIKYPLKMLTSESAVGQVNNAISSIRYLAANKISPKYIDLRVEGKAYYK